jgi:hypothetical protein
LKLQDEGLRFWEQMGFALCCCRRTGAVFVRAELRKMRSFCWFCGTGN